MLEDHDDKLRIFQRNWLKLDKDLKFSGLVKNVYLLYDEVQENFTLPFSGNMILKLWKNAWQLQQMALNLVHYDWWRLIVIRWGAKKLFPVQIGVLGVIYTGFTRIHRAVLKKIKKVAFLRKVSQISNSMIFLRKKKTFIIVKIENEEQLGYMLFKSDTFLNLQSFNTRCDFFMNLTNRKRWNILHTSLNFVRLLISHP